ncbi:unnamed protein product [Tilletia controversa]|uniref:Uncharacterized protein n=3 Tax=Tilletia TaxID=13289 RepID=A0A8X7MSI0_9BASI|nr:hypothetical protein CF336_g4772 [Tilletia laevis]KAE8195664.1 hypothetical protein CF328_g4364 [Tilletia controversa]KAE8259438.1 hypothetical protein A4X03_0g4093 [Tilletia caries]KAE8200501.1 hypothetical protein CF335_g3946 [Tilletia laevis]KAE8246120.1 hypothetical protein A4X06_0g5176 [Tilletia controversa]
MTDSTNLPTTKRSSAGASSEVLPTKKPIKAKCTLSEILQYECEMERGRVQCFHIRRIFRICEGRPAVEVTHVVEFDDNNKPFLKPEFQTAMPPSSHWNAS